MTEEEEQSFLAHYGILRRSGRYPWGSGGNAASRSNSFLGMVAELRNKGLTPVEIAQGFGMTTTQLREATTLARAEKKAADVAMAQRLKDRAWSNVKIGERMGINESSVRALLADREAKNATALRNLAEMLRSQVAEKGLVDVGSGVNNMLGISNERLKTALSILEDEGYLVSKVQVPTGPKTRTTVRVVGKKGLTYQEAAAAVKTGGIKSIQALSDDNGMTIYGLLPPLNVSSKRIQVRYAEDGGADADGVIYVRPGAKDLSLGGSQYAQVRIAVDGTHYLKGMAVHKTDLPPGIDLVFNTNKKSTGNKLDAMKEQKNDPENPFGSMVDQIFKRNADGSPVFDSNGNRVLDSAMNLVNEQGDWLKWKKSISSQVLSKQRPALAKKQLDERYNDQKATLDEIMSLTNPAVKKKLLEAFADGADSASVHLKAAALPGQASHVILPVNSMKETEVYAPNYNQGDRVVLIRYPHGGKFEIPELTVNNNHPEAKSMLGNAPDAIGINHKVAQQLSGADFDGDTVLVIPNNKGELNTAPALPKLKNFNPQTEYPAYEGMPKMSAKTKGQQMGMVSNLITDMTIKGASMDEIERAVMHSMVVIDAEKHHLNYKQSAIDRGISNLQKTYQVPDNESGKAGASTLISRASGNVRVRARRPMPQTMKDPVTGETIKLGGPIDPITGEKRYVPKGDEYQVPKVNKRTGEVTMLTKYPMESSKKLAETPDAHTLSSGTKIETIYADHSNRMKSLANTARLEMLRTPNTTVDKAAKTAYAPEVKSLNAKLDLAFRNRPLERQARLLAETNLAQVKRENPDMEPAEVRKTEYRLLRAARARTGAEKPQIEITPREWQAIQAGAITNHKLKDILNNTDLDVIKQLATPKTSVLMTSTNQARAQALLGQGKTQAEVARILGMSVSTLRRGLGSNG